MATFNVKAIANTILTIAHEHDVGLDCPKLQKLVYFAHGWHLAITKEPLIDEQVHALKFGISIPTVYDHFKEFGNASIHEYLIDFDPKSSQWIEPLVTDDKFVLRLIDRVWFVYGEFSTIELSNITHAFGSPWYQSWQDVGYDSIIIHDDIIAEYFINAVKNNPSIKGGRKISIEDISLETDNIEKTPDDKTSKELESYEKDFQRLLVDDTHNKWKRVKEYAVLWNSRRQKGIVKFVLEDDVGYKIVVKSSEELEAIANVFRFEKRVFYNIVSGSIASGWNLMGLGK
jgi:uncharacterized phage-associated protein